MSRLLMQLPTNVLPCLTVEDVCKVIRACLQSASALHAKQLVHRDFRYANVLWDSEGPFVIDLEMAATSPLKDPPIYSATCLTHKVAS
ncbi:hypothetical protein WJX77_002070 [Trebouxia sp. C0004]